MLFTASTLLTMALAQSVSLGKTSNAIILSIDGFHQGDLEYLIKNSPNSRIAQLAAGGAQFTKAKTSVPSDSFPGTTTLITGASPKTHGFYYDVAFSRNFYAVGDVNCTGPIGNSFAYDESIELGTNSNGDSTRLDGGCESGKFENGCGINVNALPFKKVDGKCVPWFPHNEMRVNTIYEVAKANGYFTGHADKHLAYDFVNGPSGNGVQDLYTPEISYYSNTLANVTTYDQLHVDAIVNWIKGNDHFGASVAKNSGFIVGANFQVVSTQQKITQYANADKAMGGYLDAQFTPTPLLTKAIAQADEFVGQIIDALKACGKWDTTLLVVGAKHGQSPVDRSGLKLLGDSNLNLLASNNNTIPSDAWTTTNDDNALIWYRDPANAAIVCPILKANAVTLGVTPAEIYCGTDIVSLFGADPATDAKVPDIAVLPKAGNVIYTKPNNPKKNMEHGGASEDDTHVVLVVGGGPVAAFKGQKFDAPVNNAQVAPTILKAIGIDINQLQGVAKEGTAPLPLFNAGGNGNVYTSASPAAQTTPCDIPIATTKVPSGNGYGQSKPTTTAQYGTNVLSSAVVNSVSSVSVLALLAAALF
ncbi:hypothetical protein HDV04_006111 [Boothiomyces sp. JEL0838]|nr:hypothetical protein HDV04_006111 [Boothiomyces sp. JEL0838]